MAKPSIYTSEKDRIADVLMANINPNFRFVECEPGRLTMHTNTPYEKEVIKEEQSAAIARLAINDAMRS